ncbi:MAG: CGNR zinc finger domain-containing protein [Actinomycetota bacterium]
MDFDHYKTSGAQVAADLVNSLATPSGTEQLPDPAALAAFLEDHGLEAPARVSRRDVEEVHAVRARIRRAFEAPDDASAAAIVNELLTESSAVPRITNHDRRWHIHYGPQKGAISARLAAVAAMGLATIICEFGRSRLGTCSADSCGDVFVDTSKNRSRRYCNDTCSTRTNVAAHRARRKQTV